jgi:hypothetical protein
MQAYGDLSHLSREGDLDIGELRARLGRMTVLAAVSEGAIMAGPQGTTAPTDDGGDWPPC